MRFYFRLYHKGDTDGDTVWCEADSWEEAEQEVRLDYHSIERLDRICSK